MSHQICVLLLGSNLGEKKNNIKKAKTMINKRFGAIIKETILLENKAIGFETNHSFINQMIKIETKLSPFQLLLEIKKIETELGRLKDSSESIEYEDRLIDIDIIIYNNIYYKSKKLKIPHHLNLYNRGFGQKLIKFI